MQRNLIQLELDDGKTVLVEVSDNTKSEAAVEGPSRRSGNSLLEKSSLKLGEAIEQIEPVATTIFSRLRVAGVEEISLELGLKFGSKAGVILASVDSEATFKLSLKWKPPKA